ncbi:hypothetical protein PIB30_057027 [Stylosanthes scabra]|uniref:non-specific serine/threonine protein kinase n=1 Tax=Stylosanthes scabra TaxID=79078 RepID=A0ABU6SK99_9FABA|nr:hypothetical protein [Stylosanthes scabra]
MASLLVMLLPPNLILLYLMILLIMIQIPPYLSSNDDNNYTSCANTTYDCGVINNIGFPFWGGNRPKWCGHPLLQLNCDHHGLATYLTIKGMRYQVLEADMENRTMKIARVDYFEGLCPSKPVNTTLDFDLFEYGPGNKNLTLFYHCSFNNGFSNFLNCFSNGTSSEHFYAQPQDLGAPPSALICSTEVFVPIFLLQFDEGDLSWNKIEGAIQNGFMVRWIEGVEECVKCMNSGGACGYDWNSNQSTCYCKDQFNSSYLGDRIIKTCDPSALAPPHQDDHGPSSDKSSSSKAPAIGASVGAVVLVVLLVGTFFVVRKRRRNAERSRSNKDTLPLSGVPLTSSTTSSSNTSQSASSYPSSKSESVVGPKSYYYGVHVFDYAELEEATKNFDPSREIGEGGFGTVYKGILQDGRVVAVKRHYESHLKRVEQYMNEVEILAHLRHKNLVSLFGCTSRHSRELILVYEFIPNGTLADHLHGSLANSTLLPWNVRYNIALETAEALSYLHSKKVIHRDVKSNNILLTENFQVKVADFGLSRLFPKFVTHVSTAPQGTPGYVDPEYYQNYQLTDKSDVYSFGVVLVELISSLQAVDITRQRNEVNLASLAVNRIQSQELHDMVDPDLGFERDNEVRRMVTAVAELAFRCLQQQREMRPSMDEVLEVLRGVKSDEFDAIEKNSSQSVVDFNHSKTEEAILLKKVPSPFSPDSVADKWVSSSSTSSTS